MSVYTWMLPGPPVSTDPGSTGSAVASRPSDLQGLLDLAFDPLSRDLVDSDDGAWVETTDSRTAVIFQMESKVNAWWADATQGSRIRQLLESGDGDPVSVVELVDEVKRCLQDLVDDGIITDLSVSLNTDEANRPVILMMYRDRSTGHPVDLQYVPFSA